jgi:hypothetical protein
LHTSNGARAPYICLEDVSTSSIWDGSWAYAGHPCPGAHEKSWDTHAQAPKVMPTPLIGISICAISHEPLVETRRGKEEMRSTRRELRDELQHQGFWSCGVMLPKFSTHVEARRAMDRRGTWRPAVITHWEIADVMCIKVVLIHTHVESHLPPF